MLEVFLMGVAMVLVIEGLVLALAPLRLEDILKALEEIGFEARRLIGLALVAVGVLGIALIRLFF